LAVSPVPGRAQDALRSVLSLAPVIQETQSQPVSLAPDRPHLGPVQLTLGGYAGVDFSDNVNASEFQPQPDVLLRCGANLGFFWPATLQSQLLFSSTFGYVHYVKNSNYDHLQIDPQSALSWAIGFDDGTITFFDQFSYSQQVLSDAALSNVATF